MKTSELSLIISFYNDIEWLKMIFEMLKKQSFKNFEVIIADDGSNEDVKAELNSLIPTLPFPVKHVWHPDNGWQKNIILNKAIESSDSGYLIFIDGDCIPQKDFLQEHYNSAERGVIVAGRRVQLTEKMTKDITPENVSKNYLSKQFFPILWAGATGKIRHAENVLHITNSFLRKAFVKERNKNLLGCNFSMFKEDILKVNGFDERFLHPATGEDTDLEARLNRIGIYVKTKKYYAIVYHKSHVRKEIEDDPNRVIFKENNDNMVSYTPFGINKQK